MVLSEHLKHRKIIQNGIEYSSHYRCIFMRLFLVVSLDKYIHNIVKNIVSEEMIEFVKRTVLFV